MDEATTPGVQAKNLKIIEYLKRDRTETEVREAISEYTGHDFAFVERCAYYAYKGYDISFNTTPKDLDEAVSMLKSISFNPKVSPAGYAALNPGDNNNDGAPAQTYFWLLWLVIERGSDKYWSFIVPATLNMIDSIETVVKTSGARFAKLIAEKHFVKLQSHGLVAVLQQALTLLLSYLPPSVEPDQAAEIHAATMSAMLALATTREEYNFLMIKAFAALELARGNIGLSCSVIKSIIDLVNKMQMLAVAHLEGLVKIFNAVACDPFADMSPELIQDAVTLMSNVMESCRPRIERYKYDIMLGVVKGRLWDTPVGQELEKYVSPLEKQEVLAI